MIKKNNILYFDECNTVKLAKKYGTPLYLISENKIIDRCNEIKSSFLTKYKNTRAIYASKAFLPLAMCKIIEREGLGLDVVSGGELFTAIKAGFPSKNIDFNGNNKSKQELELAVDYQIGRIVIDSPYELDLLIKICKKKQKEISVLFRIVPGVTSNTHDYIATGHSDSKFGISLEENLLFNTIDKALKSKYINFKGLHFHVGSQLYENTSHLKAIKITLDIILDIRNKFGFDIEDLDIGGGFAINYTDEDDCKKLSYFIDPAMKLIENFCLDNNIKRPQIIIEPGRWIIGEAGITMYEIGSIKESPSLRKYISVDGGMSDNIRPSLYQAKYNAVIANKMDEEKVDLVSISGKFCESSDILIKDIKLPYASSGDYLAIFSTGAYNYSMASNYNKNVIPKVVLLNNGKDEIIVKEQSYEDLIRNEIIPKSLGGNNE